MSGSATRAGIGLAAASALLAACGYTGSPGAQLRQWATASTYVANAKQVAVDARDLERAVAAGSALKMRTVCGGLSSDAGTLYSSLDTPDHELTDELNVSMEDFFHAAEACAVARSTRLPAVSRALGEVKAGAAELIVADRRFASFGIRSKELDHDVQVAWRDA